MSDMKIGKVPSPKKLGGEEKRTERLTFRLKKKDAIELARLAEDAEVGPSTMARLIVERYIADHGRKTRKKKR